MSRTIYIGPCEFEVTEIERLQDAKSDEALDGEIDWNAQTIHINADQHPRAKFMVLWHEMIHAVLFNAGKDEAHDEGLVEVLAQGIAQILLDNPDTASHE